MGIHSSRKARHSWPSHYWQFLKSVCCALFIYDNCLLYSMIISFFIVNISLSKWDWLATVMRFICRISYIWLVERLLPYRKNAAICLGHFICYIAYDRWHCNKILAVRWGSSSWRHLLQTFFTFQYSTVKLGNIIAFFEEHKFVWLFLGASLVLIRNPSFWSFEGMKQPPKDLWKSYRRPNFLKLCFTYFFSI